MGLIITPAVQYDIYISLIAFYFSDLEEAIYKKCVNFTLRAVNMDLKYRRTNKQTVNVDGLFYITLTLS